MSTEIYKWAQRYSFTELSSAIQQTRRRDHKSRLIFVVALLIPPLAIFTVTVLLPLAEDPLADYFQEPPASSPIALAATQTVSGIAGPVSNDHQVEDLTPRINAILIEQAFIKSRDKVATGDSLALSVDLIDSVASIELAGVQVRRCKIESIKMTGMMQRLRQHSATATWLSDPFVLSDATSSLPKIPLRVIEAPRDTAEARARNDEVIAVEKGDVYFTFYFDKYLSVTISQSQQTSARGWPSRINYWLKRGWASARKDLKTLAQFKLPSSRLHVRLEMSREDATAIYRALPANAQMALRF